MWELNQKQSRRKLSQPREFMHSVNYFEIIKKALAITWRHKFLWWFGLLVSLASAGNSFNYSFGRGNNFVSNASREIADFFASHATLVFSGIALFLVLYLAFLAIGIIGRSALIKSIEKVSAQELYDFKIGLFEGKKYFWKMLWIGIILGLAMLAAFIILAIPIIFLFINKNYAPAVLLLFLAFLIIFPLIVLTVYLRTYGHIYIVLGELRVWPAIESAYALLLKNLGTSLIMGLIFVLIGIIYGMAVMMLFAPIIAALFLLGSFLYLILKTIGTAVAVVLGILIVLAITLFLKSIYETFMQTAWILFFHEIAKSKVKELVTEPEAEMKVTPAPDPLKGSELS